MRRVERSFESSTLQLVRQAQACGVKAPKESSIRLVHDTTEEEESGKT